MPLYLWWIVVAGVFYTVTVWWVRVEDDLIPWFVWMFWVAFGLDLIGTGLMARLQPGLALNLHSTLGLAALMIMGLHALWAGLSLRSESKRAERLFHRWSPWAWGFWIIVSISGVIIHVLGWQLAFWQWSIGMVTMVVFLVVIYLNTFASGPDSHRLPSPWSVDRQRGSGGWRLW